MPNVKLAATILVILLVLVAIITVWGAQTNHNGLFELGAEVFKLTAAAVLGFAAGKSARD